jgi:hypothetical protein
MIVIDQTIISDDILDAAFCCNTQVCLGACCVDGDVGAPLEESEISALEDYIERIKPYLQPEAIRIIERYGVFDYDAEGEFVTPLIGNKDCVFVYYENGIAKCAIEKSWDNGITDFRKPISCHLYPIRIKTHKDVDAVNYHKWHICDSACKFGKDQTIPLVRFLKEPLIRKYGETWYEKLVHTTR